MTVFFLYFWTINLVGNTWKIKRLLRKGITFVLVQKNSEKGPPTDSLLESRLFPPRSPIIHLSVKYVLSLFRFECLFLSDWSYIIIFCIYYQVLQVGSPLLHPELQHMFFSSEKLGHMPLRRKQCIISFPPFFFFFGISESCSAQKCFHSSWTIKSIITAVCFANMNGHEWQQARQSFSFDLSSVM